MPLLKRGINFTLNKMVYTFVVKSGIYYHVLVYIPSLILGIYFISKMRYILHIQNEVYTPSPK
jgi:hypothetical protein